MICLNICRDVTLAVKGKSHKYRQFSAGVLWWYAYHLCNKHDIFYVAYHCLLQSWEGSVFLWGGQNLLRWQCMGCRRSRVSAKISFKLLRRKSKYEALLLIVCAQTLWEFNKHQRMRRKTRFCIVLYNFTTDSLIIALPSLLDFPVWTITRLWYVDNM